MKDKYIY